MKLPGASLANAPVAQAAVAYPWHPDRGDGTYLNPILFADYSDPDVIRHGGDYFMVASSFNCTPGLPVLRSRDLVNWKLVNHAVKNLPDTRYSRVQHGGGIWAPALRYHDGKFWIFFPTPDEGIFVTTVTHPEQEWPAPHLMQAGKGLIDPCPFWDDDGKAYLVHAYAGSRAGIKHRLHVCPMAPDGSKLLAEGQVVFHQPDRYPTIEGPKFHKRNGWYYILAPAGGVAEGWQTVLRSRNVFGPYEDKIVLEQGTGTVNGPHQGALVEDAQGAWWFMHFQDVGVYGRIVHLQPVTWVDDWPLMGVDTDGNGIGEPVTRHSKPYAEGPFEPVIPATSDEFESPSLGLQWQWHANHADDWCSLAARPGWLRLVARNVANNDFAAAPHLLAQKFPAREFELETMVDVGHVPNRCTAGLVIMGKSHAILAVRPAAAGQVEVVLFKDGEERAGWLTSAGPLRLRVQVRDGGLCTFCVMQGAGQWVKVDGTFQAQPGVWIGAKAGLLAWTTQGQPSCFADFDYFRFSPIRS